MNAKMTPTLVIDVADDPTPRLDALRASGVQSIFGYLSSIDPTGRKCWTLARMRAVTAAGLSDATTCTFLGSLVGSGSTVCPVFYNGSAWVGG